MTGRETFEAIERLFLYLAIGTVVFYAFQLGDHRERLEVLEANEIVLIDAIQKICDTRTDGQSICFEIGSLP